MKDWISLLSNWIPMFQTFLWIGLIIFIILRFSKNIDNLLRILYQRIESGSSLKAGPIEIGEKLKALEKVSAKTKGAIVSEEDWGHERNLIYKENKYIFLTHVIQPSNKLNQQFDIFIYLSRHKKLDYDDVKYVEFFFGSYWGNKVFKKYEKNGIFGISTSAYGEFLCTCRVTFQDNSKIHLNRYIDFQAV